MSSLNAPVQPPLQQSVQRSINGVTSKQPRLTHDQFVFHVLNMYHRAFVTSTPPEYNSPERATWLIDFVRQDSFLAGIVNSVVQIDRNRGWSLTGGRNQVLRFQPVFTDAEEGGGWRYFCGRAASDFYQTDLGAVVEMGRIGAGGPLGAMWNVDSTLCTLQGKPKYPLRYRSQEWTQDDFFRVVPMPSNEEKYHGLGYCAVSRALELSRIAVGILKHAQEKLAARGKKGFLSIYPMSDAKWEEIEEDADKKAQNEGRQVYEDVMVLTSEDDEIKVTLTGLSQLPDNFVMSEWVQTLVSGFSLCFGYDVGEFWSPRSSGFSRGAEAEVQSAKATGKGERDFALGMQERLQRELPETLGFEFDQRDDRAEMLIAELHEKRAKIASLLYQPAMGQAEGILSRDEIRQYLAEFGVISKELTAIVEDVSLTDTATVRDVLRESAFIRRCAERWPSETIVRYEWPLGKERVIWSRADEAIRPQVWRGITRETVVYSKNGVKITTDDVDAAIDEADDDLKPFLLATLNEQDD